MDTKYNFEGIGSFELTQPSMRASDPCYKKDVGCGGLVLPNCKPGIWEAAVANIDSFFFGPRVAALVVHHKDFPSVTKFEEIRFIRQGTTKNGIKSFVEVAGVDSGQCGFFDDTFYRDDNVCKDMELTVDFGDPWYNLCCETTLGEEPYGVIPYGAVSLSGIGDGEYPLYYIEKDNQVIAAMLQFLEFDR